MILIIQQNIFKAYDIRGVVDTELTDEAVYKIGQAVGSDAANKKQKTIVLAMMGAYQALDYVKN